MNCAHPQQPQPEPQCSLQKESASKSNCDPPQRPQVGHQQQKKQEHATSLILFWAWSIRKWHESGSLMEQLIRGNKEISLKVSLTSLPWVPAAALRGYPASTS
ncbi:hypothetical protein Tco_1044909 [Tanacetum coccineum]|uniref:Uncharacterized protein n=1 Tax=Tanacetum coccineum TaxID=301880 RepID=A0ABQ5GSC4_9ASTR